MYFPVVAELAVAATAPAESRTTHPGRGAILVVEDEPRVRRLVCAMLSDAGFETLQAETAQQALDLSSRRAGAIEAVVIDVGLPRVNGLELLEQLAQTRPAMKALMISGYSEERVASTIAVKNGVRFLSKPFTKQELLTKLRETLAE
jgi:DNA-binding NtrC family response regulator